jgi:hypothetical protein
MSPLNCWVKSLGVDGYVEDPRFLLVDVQLMVAVPAPDENGSMPPSEIRNPTTAQTTMTPAMPIATQRERPCFSSWGPLHGLMDRPIRQAGC